MAIVTTLTNAFVVAAVGALLYWHSRGRFGELKDEVKSVRDEQRIQIEAARREIADLRSEMNRRFELVDRRFELVMSENMAVRSDLTQVALALGLRGRPEANPA